MSNTSSSECARIEKLETQHSSHRIDMGPSRADNAAYSSYRRDLKGERPRLCCKSKSALPAKPNVAHDLVRRENRREMTQSEYWRMFGVTQSAGSRYESGQRLPKPVAMLVAMYESGLISRNVLNEAAEIVRQTQLDNH